MQTAYQVLVASTPQRLAQDQGDLWDSGRVASDRSIHVVYAGKPLGSHQACYWKVRAWTGAGDPSPWSTSAQWSMGLLTAADWHAKWIGHDEPPVSDRPPVATRWIWAPGGKPAVSAPIGTVGFRRTLTLPADRTVKKAVCWMSADNTFQLFVNGRRLGAGNNFHQFTSINLTEQLHAGDNCLAVLAINAGEAPNPAGLIGLVRVEFTAGEPLVLKTDRGWRCVRRPTAECVRPQFDDARWAAAQELGDNGIKPWGQVHEPRDNQLPARMLRRDFTLAKPVQRATAYVCGLGLFELRLNGQKVGDHVLEPALTEYEKHVTYVTFDVTAQLRTGANAVGVILGNGRFFAPRLAVPTNTRGFGYPKLLLQIRVEHADGSVSEIVSDADWKLTTAGPIRANNEYDGEFYDARLEQEGWDRPGFAAAAWQSAQLVAAPGGTLVAQSIEPIRVTQSLRPLSVKEVRPGVYIFDMGQNMVGWCRLAVSGPAGTQVSLRHAEILRDDGMLDVENLRSAQVTDVYVLKGQGREVYQPRFTYHGFRYVEMIGYPGRPSLETIQGQVVHDAVRPAGKFACSNPLLNRIYENIRWGVRGNYRSIPTDCPQRDERQGWLGDRSAESKGETYLFDVAALYSKWIGDMDDAQKPSGSVPDVAPAYWPIYSDNVTWPSSLIIIPGSLYQQYGDTEVLAKHYPAMKRWIDYMSGFITHGIQPRDQYGDWCVPPESPELIHSKDPARRTAKEILGTTYFYYDLRRMADYAVLLGKPADAQQFQAQAETLKTALNAKYFDAQKCQYDNGSQTSSVLPLAFDMVPPEQRAKLFEILVGKIVQQTHGHIGTGLIGGQWLMRVLSDNGRPDLAYHLAAQRSYPSWGYMADHGATTVWELWNGDTADRAMNSGNHVMLVGDLTIWLYEYLAGIRPDPARPAFQQIVLRPCPVGDLEFVEAAYDSIHGPITSRWRIAGGEFQWEFTIPVNTRATVYVPTTDSASVSEGDRPAAQAPGVAASKPSPGAAVFTLGSGHYRFRAKAPSKTAY
jgi:alpha-L-rhamnosidase